jgi:hypothetical protein
MNLIITMIKCRYIQQGEEPLVLHFGFLVVIQAEKSSHAGTFINIYLMSSTNAALGCRQLANAITQAMYSQSTGHFNIIYTEPTSTRALVNIAIMMRFLADCIPI